MPSVETFCKNLLEKEKSFTALLTNLNSSSTIQSVYITWFSFTLKCIRVNTINARKPLVLTWMDFVVACQSQPLCTGWFSWLAPGFLLVISMSLSTSLVVICQGTFQNYTFWVPGKALIILCNVSFKNNYCFFFYINFMLLFKSKFVGYWWKFCLRIKFSLCNFEISPVDISSFVLSKPNWLVLSVRKNI